MTQYFGKLVRDRIPEHIRTQGKNPIHRVLQQDEYVDQLHEKLKEEVAEYLEAQTLEELCDMLEVLEAIAEEKGFTKEQILAAKTAKAEKNGSFQRRLFLEAVEESAEICRRIADIEAGRNLSAHELIEVDDGHDD